MIFNWFGSDKQQEYDDALDELVTLIRVAQEDKAIHDRLMTVLNLPICDRQIELKSWIASCEEQGAPSYFVSSIRLMLDEEIARKTLQAISD